MLANVTVPVDLSIPPTASSVDSSLTSSQGDAVSLSIGGVFQITMLTKTPAGGGPQTVTFRLGLKPGTARPGFDNQPIKVVVGGNPTPITSPPIEINF